MNALLHVNGSSRGRRASTCRFRPAVYRASGASATSAVAPAGASDLASPDPNWRDRLRPILRPLVAVAAALSVSACATQPARTAEQRAADDALAARVELALSHDPEIYARHIDVDADGGIVRLSGFVWSANDFYEAKRIAATVPGVISVESRMEMMVGGRTGAR